jgi:hypothetical protein
MEDTSSVDIICRQTDYTRETALEKLKQFDYNYTAVIKDFMGIQPKTNTRCPYVSQERYKIIRQELDNACRNYREKKDNENIN